MEGRQFNRRTLAILVVLTALLLLLFFGVLYNLQVLHVDDYRAQSVVKIATGRRWRPPVGSCWTATAGAW